jgi:O-succinylbenzoic acid--CoA ligase
MPIPLKLVAANDTVGALLALADALAGKQAVFITAPETNGLMPEVHGLPNEVDQDVALIVESSGSTGTPKRISLSAAALVASAKASEARLAPDAAVNTQSQWLVCLPINYVVGANVLIRSLVADTQPVLMNTTLPFTADAFARSASLMTAERRFVSLVPTQLLRLVNQAGIDDFLLAGLKRFDAILLGGQAPDSALLQKAADLGLNVVQSYGMAETAGGCVYDGKPLDGVSVRIGKDQIIEISGPTLANNVADENGWYRTNDLGEFDADGNLVILGRANRVLASGGIKVSLDSIEEVVRQIGGVADAAAISVLDTEWGERAVLVYVGSPEVADYIAAEILNNLGAAAKPVRVIRVDAIPRLNSGKADYVWLKNQFSG